MSALNRMRYSLCIGPQQSLCSPTQCGMGANTTVVTSVQILLVVTCDGTWCKRGFTATHGVVVVIAWETGQVLDFQIMTKRCSICARKKTALGEDSQEFADWWEGHKDSCEINHHGSSPSMECAGAPVQEQSHFKCWQKLEEAHDHNFVAT